MNHPINSYQSEGIVAPQFFPVFWVLKLTVAKLQVTAMAQLITWSTQYCAQPNEVSTICANYVVGHVAIAVVKLLWNLYNYI